jgi:hypothetical protein
MSRVSGYISRACKRGTDRPDYPEQIEAGENILILRFRCECTEDEAWLTRVPREGALNRIGSFLANDAEP